MVFHLILALFTLFIIGRQIEGERLESRALEFWITEIGSIRPTPGIPRPSEVITHGSRSNEHGCSQLRKQKEDWCLLTQFCWKAGRCKPNCSSTLDGFPGPPFAFISFPISSNCDGEGRKHARQSWVLKHANWNEVSLMFPVCQSVFWFPLKSWTLLSFHSDEIWLIHGHDLSLSILELLWFLFSAILWGPKSFQDASGLRLHMV